MRPLQATASGSGGSVGAWVVVVGGRVVVVVAVVGGIVVGPVVLVSVTVVLFSSISSGTSKVSPRATKEDHTLYVCDR